METQTTNKQPKIIFNKWIPFKGFYACNIFGMIFIRKEYESYGVDPSTINHELIHTAQMKETLYIGFYIWYFIEWIIRLLFVSSTESAYRNISFEREAYENEYNQDYLKTRKKYTWLKNIFKKI